MTSQPRSAKQAIACWASDVLRHWSDQSPRCPKYPACGGEDGSGVFEHGEGKALVEEHRYKRDLKDVMVAARANAPRCRECAKYRKALDRLLGRLDREAAAGGT